MKASTILPFIAVMSASGLSAADQSFGPPLIVPGSANQDAESPQIAGSGRNVYILWHENPDVPGNPLEVYIARSTNRAGSFAPRINLSASTAVDSQNEDLAVAGHNVYVAWSENLDSVRFRRSTNNAQSFGAVQVLSVAPGAMHPQVAVDDDHVFVVWEAAGNANEQDIFFAESDDGGNSFGAERNISNNAEDSVSPQILVSGDRVIVIWSDGTTPLGDREVFVVRSE